MKTTSYFAFGTALLLLGVPIAVQAQFTYITTNGAITITRYNGPGGAVNIPATIIGLPVTSIGDNAFFNCQSLTNVTIPNSVTSLGDSAFFSCLSLASVTIPNSVTNIGQFAFSDCDDLTNVIIGASVISIGDYAFSVCYSLTSVTIPDSVTSIGQPVFYSCTGVTNISVGAANSVYSSLDGVLFNKAQTTLIQFPGGRGGSYAIPNSVTNIGDYAFYDCKSLTDVFFAGNAPAADSTAFVNYTYSGDWIFATAYYLPGTTGWDDFSANTGVPAVLWTPQIESGDGSFGVRSNQFGFNIAWASGQTVIVEAATSLSSPVWIPVATNTLTSGTSYFSDPQPANLPGRFYRLRSP